MRVRPRHPSRSGLRGVRRAAVSVPNSGRPARSRGAMRARAKRNAQSQCSRVGGISKGQRVLGLTSPMCRHICFERSAANGGPQGMTVSNMGIRLAMIPSHSTCLRSCSFPFQPRTLGWETNARNASRGDSFVQRKAVASRFGLGITMARNGVIVADGPGRRTAMRPSAVRRHASDGKYRARSEAASRSRNSEAPA